MDKRNRIDNSFLEYITVYLSNSIAGFFNALDLDLPNLFLIELEKGLKELAKEYSRFSFRNTIKIKYDYLTLKTIKLNKILGFEKTTELSEKAFNYCFKLIVEKEPEEIISGLIKNERNFSVLLHCYEKYLRNSLNKRFGFYNQLGTERRDLLYEKIITKLLSNSSSFLDYDSTKSRFRTFLYHALEYSAYNTFREEGFEISSYAITKKNILAFADEISLQINSELLESFEPDKIKYFFSRKDVTKWFLGKIGERNFEKHKNLIWNYVKTKAEYKNPLINIDNSYLQNLSQNTNIGKVLTQEEKTGFINSLKNIEKDSLYRIMLKLRLGLNINYLNDELRMVFKKENINLELLEKLNELVTISNDSNFKVIFETFYRFFSKYSDKVRNVSPEGIRRRIYRCYEKIRRVYDSDDFSGVLVDFRERFDISFLESPPLFLVIKSESDLAMFNKSLETKNLKMINLCDNNLKYIPDIIFNFVSLEELDLSKNMIKKTPKDIMKLSRLETLDLRNQYDIDRRSSDETNSSKVKFEFSQSDKLRLEKLLPGCNILFD